MSDPYSNYIANTNTMNLWEAYTYAYVVDPMQDEGDSPIVELIPLLPGLKTRFNCPHLAEAGWTFACFDSHGKLPEDTLALWEIIIHLNDDCDWTREQVADWLETLDVDLSFLVEVDHGA